MVGVGAQVGKDGAQEQQPAFACKAAGAPRAGGDRPGVQRRTLESPLVAWFGRHPPHEPRCGDGWRPSRRAPVRLTTPPSSGRSRCALPCRARLQVAHTARALAKCRRSRRLNMGVRSSGGPQCVAKLARSTLKRLQGPSLLAAAASRQQGSHAAGEQQSTPPGALCSHRASYRDVGACLCAALPRRTPALNGARPRRPWRAASSSRDP